MRLSRQQEAVHARTLHWLMPLHFFYEREGRTLPRIEFVAPDGLPANERELLVHDHDMTSALAEYHQSELALNVIGKEESADYLMRLVALERTLTPRVPVEFGAIGIHLESFNDHARKLVTACRQPLGAILEDEKISYHSHPQAFFKVEADDFIAELLAEAPGTVLWGRCNQLASCDGIVFADIVEILPRALAAVPPTVHRNSGRNHHCGHSHA